jgi:hypothetical protein
MPRKLVEKVRRTVKRDVRPRKSGRKCGSIPFQGVPVTAALEIVEKTN